MTPPIHKLPRGFSRVLLQDLDGRQIPRPALPVPTSTSSIVELRCNSGLSPNTVVTSSSPTQTLRTPTTGVAAWGCRSLGLRTDVSSPSVWISHHVSRVDAAPLCCSMPYTEFSVCRLTERNDAQLDWYTGGDEVSQWSQARIGVVIPRRSVAQRISTNLPHVVRAVLPLSSRLMRYYASNSTWTHVTSTTKSTIAVTLV